jgi:D-threo-aldose 1-dehydrogenase
MSYTVRPSPPGLDVYVVGCAPLAVSSVEWAPGDWKVVSDADADAAIATALRLGLTQFDTAPLYNNGVSEMRLGHGLSVAGGTAAAAKVWTKVGKLVRGAATGMDPAKPLPPDPETGEMDGMLPDFSAAGAVLSYEESAGRTGLSFFEGLRVHDPDDIEGGIDACLAPDGILAGMVKLRKEGKIARVGLGMNANKRPDLVLRLLREAPPGTFDDALLAGGWNLLGQASLPILVECEKRNIKVANAGVFATGYLVGGDAYLYDTPPPEIVAARQSWQTLADRYNVSLPAVALRFASQPSVVEKVLLGVKSAQEVELNVSTIKEAATVPLALWYDAKAEGLLSDAIVLPPRGSL